MRHMLALGLILAVGAGLVTGCGEQTTDSPIDEPTDLSSIMPLKSGNWWNYRVTDGAMIEEKKVTVLQPQTITLANGKDTVAAFQVASKTGSKTAVSVQADLSGKIVRFSSQTFDDTLGLQLTEVWSPYRIHVDGTAAHTRANVAWNESFDEVVTQVGQAAEHASTSEHWSVVSDSEYVTVPAGTFSAIKIQKTSDTKLKTYWYVRGIGKVKEQGGQVEELSSYNIEP